MPPRPFLVLALGVALAACAVRPPARPEEFPFHDAWLLGTLHWRLDQAPGAVTATGLLEVSQPGRVEEVELELQGMDATGRIVARARTTAAPRSFTGTEPWPLAARLSVRGPDLRFVLRVAAVRWRVQRAGS